MTTTAALPVLYSFRRCPYAMRARMAIAVSRVSCELREVTLRDKPAALLQASAKGTVPVLVDVDGQVVDESLDIMRWALARNDPENWLTPEGASLQDMLELIVKCDGPFKHNLDRYKYATRYVSADGSKHRAQGAVFLSELNINLANSEFLHGSRPALSDRAIAPFVRQFAQTDQAWFDAQPWPYLQAWLAAFLISSDYLSVMDKYAPWQAGAAPVYFPA